MKVKLHDKLGALRLLGLKLGMFKKRHEVDVASKIRSIVDAVQREAAPLPINHPNAGRALRVVSDSSLG